MYKDRKSPRDMNFKGLVAVEFKGVSACREQGGLFSEGVEEERAVLHFSFQIAGYLVGFTTNLRLCSFFSSC